MRMQFLLISDTHGKLGVIDEVAVRVRADAVIHAGDFGFFNDVSLSFSRPGKPKDNAISESFNGSFRDECLNTNWFISLEDAERKIEAWRRHYNESRPHMSLAYRTSQEFLGCSQNQLPNTNIMTGT